MADQEIQSGSDALTWLDSHMIESGVWPDEAFDWIFMLHEDDWPLLEGIWPQRPVAWREACAYLLGRGPVAPAQRLLRLALADADIGVATEAALSLCDQMLHNPQEAPMDATLLPRLREIREANGGKHTEEIDAFLERYQR